MENSFLSKTICMIKKTTLHKKVVVPNVKSVILANVHGKLLIGVVPKCTADIRQIPKDIKVMPKTNCQILPRAG